MSRKAINISVMVAAWMGCLLLLPAHAEGAAFEFNLDTLFSGFSPESATTPWLRATVEDAGVDTVSLKLETLNLVDAEFVREWYFNFNPDKDPDILSFAHVSGVDADMVETGDDEFQADGDGKFDILFTFPPSGAGRFTGGLESMWTITGTGITAADFNFESTPGGGEGTFYSAAHVQGIGDADDLSGWIGSGEGIPPDSGNPPQAPEPTTLVFLSLGLLTFGSLRRSTRR